MSTQQEYLDKRGEFRADHLEQYRGRWVAFSLDGSKILAEAESEIDLAKRTAELRLSPSQYVMEPIPEDDTLLL